MKMKKPKTKQKKNTDNNIGREPTKCKNKIYINDKWNGKEHAKKRYERAWSHQSIANFQR